MTSGGVGKGWAGEVGRREEGGGPGIGQNLKTFNFVDFKIPTCRKQLEQCISKKVFDQFVESRNGKTPNPKFLIKNLDSVYPKTSNFIKSIDFNIKSYKFI